MDLLEAACVGDAESVQTMLAAGVAINKAHGINQW
jgi:hypothetical protein